MVFSSPTFVWLFLPLVLAAYFLVPKGARVVRNAVLLLASLLFYAWGEQGYVVLMLAVIGASYAFGLALGQARGQRARRLWLTVAVAFDLGILVAFKYASWLSAELSVVWTVFGLDAGTGPAHWGLAEVHLPIGVSFFTFQALSYVIDVYRGSVRPQRSLIDFALYVASFPQLIAGPIVRYKQIAKELRSRCESRALFAFGARRFAIGLAKKLLIANVLARVADPLFELAPAHLSMGAAWLGVAAYTLQIYFDFSGYSDMAIGLGACFGFHFPENFAHPYTARSVIDFWRRWHISLSSWFRDYLYIPLGGSRHGRLKTARNLLSVFLLCGLWHGASWNFLVWGLFHGAFLVLERSGWNRRPGSESGSESKSKWGPGRALAAHVYLLLVVMVGWVFFRAPDLAHALEYLNAMFVPNGAGGSGATELFKVPAVRYIDHLVATVFAIGVLGCYPWLDRGFDRLPLRFGLGGRGWVALGDVGLATCLLLCALVLSAGTLDPFLYFRF